MTSAVSIARRAALEDQFMQRVEGGAEHAAGVGQLEAGVLPHHRVGKHVAGGAGDGLTIARRVPVRRLKRVDLPTFGRPTSTTDGRRLGGTAESPYLTGSQGVVALGRTCLKLMGPQAHSRYADNCRAAYRLTRLTA